MVVLQGRKMAALVHPWSTIVRMASLPRLGGRFVMRSMATVWKGRVPFLVDMRKDGICRGCVHILFCWHVAHPRMYYSVHFLNPGHQKCFSSRSMVRSQPECPLVGALWFLWRICCLSDLSGGMTIFLSLVYIPCSSWVTSLDFLQSSISEWWQCWASSRFCRNHSQGVSVVLTKIWGGRSVRLVLSFSPLSSNGGLNNMFAAVCSFPGTCLIWKL